MNPLKCGGMGSQLHHGINCNDDEMSEEFNYDRLLKRPFIYQ